MYILLPKIIIRQPNQICQPHVQRTNIKKYLKLDLSKCARSLRKLPRISLMITLKQLIRIKMALILDRNKMVIQNLKSVKLRLNRNKQEE